MILDWLRIFVLMVKMIELKLIVIMGAIMGCVWKMR